MKTVNSKRLFAVVEKVAARDGIDWPRHFARANQVIVFGSHALGLQTPHSDIDLLCIGSGRSCSTRMLQILWMSRSQFDDHVRRGSELACHIAAYGVWMKGDRCLPQHITPSSETIARRKQKIQARCNALVRNWSALAPEFRTKHVYKVRRDLQRLQSLRRGEPNLPAPALDARWATVRNQIAVMREWISHDRELEAAFCPTLVDWLQHRCASSLRNRKSWRHKL